MSPETHSEAVKQAAIATPSLSAIIVWIAGVPIEKWAALLGMCLIALQVAHGIWKWRRDIRHERERTAAHRVSHNIDD